MDQFPKPKKNRASLKKINTKRTLGSQRSGVRIVDLNPGIDIESFNRGLINMYNSQL